MKLLQYLPVKIVDSLILANAKLVFGNLSKYGIHRPNQGPFAFKAATGKTPVIDRGAVEKIQAREIQVPSCYLKLIELLRHVTIIDYYSFLLN